MQPHQIESKVLNIIQRVEAGQPIEDSTVELKSNWIPAEKAARIIAGHANAARGAQILWIIGIDEKAHQVVGASDEELANWYPKVQAEFDGWAPRIFSHLCIPVKDQTVVALLFDTNRAPFVVKNPSFGKPDGGPVKYEVPWRENTSTRSARRDDLLMLLSPLQVIPSFEVLDGYFEIRNRDEISSYYLSLTLYVETTSQDVVVIPFHKAHIKFSIPNVISSQLLTNLHLGPPYSPGWGLDKPPKSLSLTIKSTQDEALIHGPGKIILAARLETSLIKENLEHGKILRVDIDLLPIGTERHINISVELNQTQVDENDTSVTRMPLLFKWVVPPPETNLQAN